MMSKPFIWENNISNLSSIELAHRMVKVKMRELTSPKNLLKQQKYRLKSNLANEKI